ncbi:hypothetical protein [Jiangella mangrovi]|uniref:hypothetical protein n=1 Tax=Jiangella mangrovi TaxID=1524084 RepID=UPI0031B574BD
MGPSGSGKTTLLDYLSGLDDIRRRPASRRPSARLESVPQSPSTSPSERRHVVHRRHRLDVA